MNSRDWKINPTKIVQLELCSKSQMSEFGNNCFQTPFYTGASTKNSQIVRMINSHRVFSILNWPVYFSEQVWSSTHIYVIHSSRNRVNQTKSKTDNYHMCIKRSWSDQQMSFESNVTQTNQTDTRPPTD